MSDGTIVKADKDFTETLDKDLPEIDALCRVSSVLVCELLIENSTYC